jgi:8-oxo-dGTP pyrophosphatase MutT (NUDIX family)
LDGARLGHAGNGIVVAVSEELNDSGTVTVPRDACTVILLRGGGDALEVLLVQRNPQARFMGGAWVFPGGAVDPGETDVQAAVRELHEEAAVRADPGALVAFSRWIAPAEVKVRFDTRFFVTTLPADQSPAVDGAECVDLRWMTPTGALAAHRAGELLLVFPTIKHLEQLMLFDSADAVLAHARTSDIQPVQPRVVFTGETARILLPGEPGFDDA